MTLTDPWTADDTHRGHYDTHPANLVLRRRTPVASAAPSHPATPYPADLPGTANAVTPGAADDTTR